MGETPTSLEELSQLDFADSQYATRFVEQLLDTCWRAGASDVHLQPTAEGLEVRWRMDGVLQPVGRYAVEGSANIVARLKVLADLLTYRSDIPQEGRIREEKLSAPWSESATGTEKPENDSPQHKARAICEMRVSTFPTLFGERAVVRLFPGAGEYQFPEDLGLPQDVHETLLRLLQETSGAILVTGPAGSGKSTTLYACLRHLVRDPSHLRSIVSLEDPIEVAVPGVSQSQTNPNVGFDLKSGLKFLMRQDPEVLMVGEMRDPETARLALQASLTGHLLLTSFHAGSAAGAVSRLSDMGVEPYLLRSGVLGILCQRLLRRLCLCSKVTEDPEQFLGLPVAQARTPVGCEQCGGTGYRGRFVLVEMLTPQESDVSRAILSRSDAAQLEQLAVEEGMITRWQRVCEMVTEGKTSPAEARRVLGFPAAGQT